MEREVNARLRASQDEAYAESLAADQEKERRRAAERAARELREHEDLQRRQQEEKHKMDVCTTHYTYIIIITHTSLTQRTLSTATAWSIFVKECIFE